MKVKTFFLLLCVLATSCTKSLYYTNKTKSVPLFRIDRVTCEKIDDVTLKVRTFEHCEEMEADYQVVEEGYSRFPYVAKTTEIVFWFPLSVALFPIPFVFPIAPDRIHPATIPLRLLDPTKSIAYTNKLVSTEHVVQREWNYFTEHHRQYTSPNTTIFVGNETKRSTFKTNNNGNLIVDIRDILSPDKLNKSFFVIGQGNSQFKVLVNQGQIEKILPYKISQKNSTTRTKILDNLQLKLSLNKNYFLYGSKTQLNLSVTDRQDQAKQSKIEYQVSLLPHKSEHRFDESPPMTTLGIEQLHFDFTEGKQLAQGTVQTSFDGKATIPLVLPKFLNKKRLPIAEEYGISGKSSYEYIKILFKIENQECTFQLPIYYPTLIINVIPSRDIFRADKDNHLNIFVTNLDEEPVQANIAIAMDNSLMYTSTDENGNVRVAIPLPELSFSEYPSPYAKEFLKSGNAQRFPVTVWAINTMGLHGKVKNVFSYDYDTIISKRYRYWK